MAYLYRHIRHDTNQVFYVGIGSDNTYRRARQTSGRNDLWNKTVSKTEYSIEIMLDGLSREEVLEKEKEFIRLYGRRNTNTGTLVNLTDGGLDNKGFVLSDEVRSKMREASKNRVLTPELRRAFSDAAKNRVFSEEARMKMSEANKGKPKPQHVIDAVKKANTGKIHTAETRKKLSDARKNRIIPAEVGRKISASLKGRERSSDHNRNNAISNYRFTNEQIIEIKKLSVSGLNCVQIGNMYGVSSSCIHLIVKNKSYKHVA